MQLSAVHDELWVIRHGETEWSRDGRHTSHTEVELTPEGEEVARGLAERLAGVEFDLVLTSPRVRARRTAELAGFDRRAGRRRPGRVGLRRLRGRHHAPRSARTSPAGRSGRTRAPAERPPKRCRAGWTAWWPRCARNGGRVLVFSHGHASRALAARWLDQPVEEGRLFLLGTATISVLGYERESPVVARWNS